MLNIDVALNSFWQFAIHWKNCETLKIELSCEGGSLQMTMNSKLDHPDKLHFPAPPDPLIKKKFHSMIRHQKCRKKLTSNKYEETVIVIEKFTENV